MKLRALKHSVLPIITLSTIVGFLFAQSQGTYTAYTGNDALWNGGMINGQTTRWVGNSAICVNPAQGRYIGDSLRQTCSCDNGCVVYLTATAGQPYSGDLHQSADAYVPGYDQLYWQDWLYVHEDCVDLAAGIPFGEIVENNGSGSCYAPY